MVVRPGSVAIGLRRGNKYINHTPMNKATEKPKPKRGRPPTGRNIATSVVLTPELLARITAFAEDKSVSQSEAIRLLLERGLRK
jgi:hypothetical protein